MAAKKKNKEQELLKAGMYKGYSISWLEKNPEHPDHALAEEGRKKREKLLKKDNK